MRGPTQVQSRAVQCSAVQSSPVQESLGRILTLSNTQDRSTHTLKLQPPTPSSSSSSALTARFSETIATICATNLYPSRCERRVSRSTARVRRGAVTALAVRRRRRRRRRRPFAHRVCVRGTTTPRSGPTPHEPSSRRLVHDGRRATATATRSSPRDEDDTTRTCWTCRSRTTSRPSRSP